MIGAGLAGLSAACQLTAAGPSTSRSSSGGRPGRTRRVAWSRTGSPSTPVRPCSRCASWWTRRCARLGTEIDDVIALQRLDPAYRARLRRRRAHPRAARPRRHAGRRSPSSAAASTPRPSTTSSTGCARSTRWRLPHFIDRNYDSPARRCCPRLRAARPAAPARCVRPARAPRSAQRFRDHRLHRLFCFQAMYAGLAPDDALAIYAVITYMDSIEGVWFPDGGMRAVPQAMADALDEGRRRVPLLGHGELDPAPAGRRRCAGVRTRPTGAGPGRRRGLHPRPADRLPGPAARPAHRPADARRPAILAVGRGVARRCARALPTGSRPPQHPLRCLVGQPPSTTCW